MRNMHLAVLVVAGVATAGFATTAKAQDEAVNREVLRALNQLRHEVSILKEQNRHLKGEFIKLKETNGPTLDVSTAVPLKEVSEQRKLINQQASRIDGLEARNTSLQESVDAVLNQPPPPPVEAVEIIDYVAPGWLAGRGYSGQTGWVADVRAIYIFQSEIGHAPAFGQLTGPTIDRSAGNAPPAGVQGSSHNLSAEPVSLNGPGFRFSLLNQNSDGWFRGVVYEGIFINGKTRAGGATDIDNIHANLHSRTLADNNALNDDFDSGLVDFASDDVTLDQQIVDIIFGKKSQVSDRTTTFWNVGVRVASSDMKREVLYRNVEDLVLPGPIVVPDADTDTANVDFNSEMLGLGPVLGAGGTWKFGRSLALSGDVSLAAVYSNFDLRRNERNFNQSLSRTAFSDITMESSGVVPMMQCSFELSYQMASDWNCAIGYNASLLVGGARSIAIPGWDDVDDETSPYVVEENDIFSHGVYLRVSYFLGS